ncbi:vWA domain-containing protein [Roseivivax sediminis]|uniref:Ca-activated chloride channel family protein n=1 Tax=Roseivivax sediminis TaxID=936889 RepID=A0A1I2D048_9RHOB|nr:VWA domain-containing protein [Roseivivax sediminis]SFE73937.1 Ca-activated chloride channel family protein [Roseivivax sediminis]
MRRLAALALTAFCLARTAQAQEQEQTILVLDGSGSMWGQIDGTAKITIAQDVVGDLMESLPEGRALGLAAYGHRERGDCTDIETMVPPGRETRGAISAAVGSIQPKGKTPMTDAVIAAAEALRYTQEKATVILVSDGIETCHPDPCAAARTLEETGLDFTAHVIGFDVEDSDAIGQMRCLAEETGGRFLAAADASELGAALQQVAAAEPQTTEVTFRATLGENGPEVTDPLIWDITGEGELPDPAEGAMLTLPLPPGEYRATATRASDEESAGADFTVEAGAEATVTVVLPAPLPGATLAAAEDAVAGATIPVTWTGPDAASDYIAVSQPDDAGYVNYTYTRDGSPLNLTMPPHSGTYELRYILADGDAVLATRAITVTPVEAELEADEIADAGATIPVVWLGPDYRNDYVAVAVPGEDGYVNYTYTRDGSPLRLQMPAEPGDYELRYVMAQDSTVLTTRAVRVDPVTARLYADARANAGATLSVDWDGPDYGNDYIAIARPEDTGYETYSYTRDGAPLDVTVPLEPGRYELRYVMAQEKTVLAAQPLEVVDVTATLNAPETARAGAPVLVTWEGPGYDKDYVSVSFPGDPGYAAFRYTRDGSPLVLDMPTAAGEYELRYVAASVGEQVLARRAITLEPVSAAIDAPDTVAPAANIPVTWEGPDYRRDFVGIVGAGAPDGEYIRYVYTSEDSPVVLAAPDAPGDYELRYHLGRDSSVIARTPITVAE